MLVDVILGENEYICSFEAGDITQDGFLNVMDVIGLIQIIMGSTESQAMIWIEKSFEYIPMNTITIDTL